MSVSGFRSFTITDSNVLEVQNLPGDIVRLKAIGSGSTFLYIWDSRGRQTFEVVVSSIAPSTITAIRPGYNPEGTEFIYHVLMNNQFVDQRAISPFWTHEFSSSVPFRKTDEWRTFLNASTNPNRFSDSYTFPPFSKETYLDQFLTYYRSENWTAAAGDINYFAGELSVNSFPLRGASFRLQEQQSLDQLQIFAGANRPQFRSRNLFNDPADHLYGFSGSKEILSDIVINTSFVYFDQPAFNPVEPTTVFESDFVADLGIRARPFSQDWTFEGEYGRSSEENAGKALVEYSPYWGRVLASYKIIGDDYVKPANFFLFRNYRETNFLADYFIRRDMSFLFGYQWTEFGVDPPTSITTTNVHRFTLTNLYRVSEVTTYISAVDVSKTFSDLNPQDLQRAYLTYEHRYEPSKDVIFIQGFAQHSKNFYPIERLERVGGGSEVRYTHNFSPAFQIYGQGRAEFNYVDSTLSNDILNPTYLESLLNFGPTVTYYLGNKVFSAGFFDNLNFQDFFSNVVHQFQPFGSAYYNPNQALTLGVRLISTLDPSNDYYYLSVVGDLIYRFGSKIPDTLLSAFGSSAKVRGVIFFDQNDDGSYQQGEPLVDGATVELNNTSRVDSPDGNFRFDTRAGKNQLFVTLPDKYKHFQFLTENPAQLDLFPKENELVYFGVSQRIVIAGKVMLYSDPKDRLGRGFGGAIIVIEGPDTKMSLRTSSSGVFNVFVKKPGLYKATVQDIEFPPGYKTLGNSTYEIVAKEGQLNQLPDFTLEARRRVFGRAFLDKNSNGTFDEGEKPVGGVKISLGEYSTFSDTDGTFLFASIPANTYFIKVSLTSKEGHRLNLGTNKVIMPEAGTIQLDIPYQP